MSLYFVRVRLDRQGGPRPSYALLHADMEPAGFVRFIRALDDRVKKLPSGSYLKATEEVPAAVLLEVETIASAYVGMHEIIVARATDVRLSGLKSISEAAGLLFIQRHPDICESQIKPKTMPPPTRRRLPPTPP